MHDAIKWLSSEPGLRLSTFLAVLAVMAVWEVQAPRRTQQVKKPLRWASNLGLVVLNTIVLRLIAPLTAVGIAAVASARGWGLLNQINLPGAVKGLLAIVALDLVIYLQHVMFHAVPALWRLHMVHHADLDIDVTTGVRFHTFEILLSMLLKMAAVTVIGPPPWSVVAFEILLNGTSLFNHGNVAFPGWLDRILRLLVVTPDMHRVHHSIDPRETNSNFGFNLPWWDYALGTYRAQPMAGHENMTIGVQHIREEKIADRLPRMLALPFLQSTGDYPLQRRSSKSAGASRPTDHERRQN